MALHEKMKHAIIAEEIFGYLLNKGFSKIDVSMDISEEATLFTVTVYDSSIPIKEELERDLYCSREQELEEYGWDVYCDSASKDFLNTLSMLIDFYTIDEQHDKTVITFHRQK